MIVTKNLKEGGDEMIDQNNKYTFRLFLASTEINYRCCKDVTNQNWLVSFYYLRRMPKGRLISFLEDAKHGLHRLGINQERCLFLDSGAFSFQNAAGFIPGRQNQDTAELDAYSLLKYTLDYIDFIEEYGHYFDIIVEVDVDYVLGVKKTKYLFDRMRNEGVDIRPVWHVPRGEKIWIDESNTYDYHGIEGQTRHRDDPISFYNQMITISHNLNSRVHGFAMSDMNIAMRVPFDSVDSASWMLQAANGTVKTPFGTIAISDRSVDSAEVGDSLNYANLKSLQKAQFNAYVTSHGFTIEQLMHEWKDRAALNCVYYQWMEDQVNAQWSYLNNKKVFQKNLFSV